MLKEHTSLNVNRLVGLHDPREDAAVSAALSDASWIARQPAAARSASESGPAATSTIASTSDVPISLWWSVLASFAEGFGAYGVVLYPTADFPIHDIPVARRESPPHRRGRELIAIAHEYEPGLLSESRNIVQLGGGSARDAQPPWLRNPLALIYDAGVALWARWRRERQIRRAVAALAEFDDRTLRDMGIPSRSEIEQVVRYCHDC